MVYDWEAHKDVIVRLYADEGLEVDDIIEHMQKNYNFSPRYVLTLIVFLRPDSSNLYTRPHRPVGHTLLSTRHGY